MTFLYLIKVFRESSSSRLSFRIRFFKFLDFFNLFKVVVRLRITFDILSIGGARNSTWEDFYSYSVSQKNPQLADNSLCTLVQAELFMAIVGQKYYVCGYPKINVQSLGITDLFWHNKTGGGYPPRFLAEYRTE